jgi:hypothetical protein
VRRREETEGNKQRETDRRERDTGKETHGIIQRERDRGERQGT